MRLCFVLMNDDRDDLQAVSDYDMGEFDLTSFGAGGRLLARYLKM